jgi:hypothetical protein
MKYTCLFSAIAIMATSVSADLFGISGAVFTLWTGEFPISANKKHN